MTVIIKQLSDPPTNRPAYRAVQGKIAVRHADRLEAMALLASLLFQLSFNVGGHGEAP